MIPSLKLSKETKRSLQFKSLLITAWVDKQVFHNNDHIFWKSTSL